MRRKTKKKWPVIAAVLVVFCILGGLGIALADDFPDFLVFSKNVVQQVQKSGETLNGITFEKVKIPEEDVSRGYYYQQLDAEEQALYKELYQGMLDFSQTVYVHSTDMEVISNVCQFIFCDRPEVFWCTGEMQLTSYEEYSEVQLTYTCTEAEKNQKQSQIDSAVAECLSGISGTESEYEKIKYVFEYLVNTVTYNLDASDNQNIYSALVGKASVCAGYSRAAQYVLQKLGLECIYVTGTVPGQGAHAWNIVRCNEQYYQMDVTFGDPLFVQAESGENVPDQSINYDYLCCSDAEIMKNHTVDTLVNYPSCNSMDLNYYRLNNMYYEEFQAEHLLQNMNQSIYRGESSFTCKFANDTLYQQAHDVVLNDLIQQTAQNLMEYYGLETVQYTYIEDDIMDKMIIFWNYQ